MKRKEIMKRLLIVVPVIVAVAVVIGMVKSPKKLEKKAAGEVARQVRTIVVQHTDVMPRAIGYGYVEPDQVWQVVPEVSGKIVSVSQDFKKGNFVHSGQVLLNIDPTNYELTVNRMTANIESIKAQLAELDSQEKNYQTSLKIQQTLSGLKKKELERNEQAMKSMSISSSALDQSVMEYQSQLAQVQEIDNSLNLIPTSRLALHAELKSSEVQLEEAQVDLTRAEIKAPFNCRITETSAEVGQYVQQGATVAKADSTSRAEITAQVPLESMLKLLAGIDKTPIKVTSETMGRLKMDTLRDRFGLKVKVRLVNMNDKAVWDADFTRTDATIDAQTRTMGVIVAVDGPYEQIILGERPPLVRNMFCEVEVIGRPFGEQIVVPRSTLHGGLVYVVDEEDRLQWKKVTVAFTQSDFAVISDGLTVGDQIVVSDVMPAVEGMLLSPKEDQELKKRLMDQARGLADVH